MKISTFTAACAVLLTASAAAAPGAVHFDSGSLVVRRPNLPLIAAHCQFAADHPDMQLQLQGHTDLRGSREFSLGIGQARAERVRALLAACGVAEQRMEALSLGKERPLIADYSAAAGRANRRVEIVYLAPGQPPSQPPSQSQ